MQKNKLPNLVVILILTLVTAVMWISFSIYRSITSKPAPAVPESISNPLTPSLDAQTLNQLNSRIFLDNTQIPEMSVTVPTKQAATQPSASPSAIPTPVATPVASPSATPAG